VGLRCVCDVENGDEVQDIVIDLTKCSHRDMDGSGLLGDQTGDERIVAGM
jgi:hypothetical protein